MACGYCEKEHSLLSGEDWRVFIRENRLVCTVGGEDHDYKEINTCPVCDEPLIEPQPLTLEQLEKMNHVPIWVKTITDKTGKYNDWCILNDGNAEIPMCDHWWFELKNYNKTWLAYDRPPKELSRDAAV